ncbi:MULTISPECIES: hypothetical protein [unclassified Bradyrhizobium]|uniref:hypothetical protein n=1 Tax=unclassified Bradyrhizobium TaxID=2631580 RepID=UPI001FF92197|nr:MULTISPECIES: hypothetical protein [unclassified Bradyrhizobium]MCK1294921.1 hypothetical protein [Bradyrhizobium sp. 30]MCK1304747.1 hypothetical protein [Bradyrhizobium sp. 45]MCK1314128.1 hypothetical protein [Bradyrhizobium sp. 23]MCK1505420.1 hypothetical protein [Bradyrhizobium sp. 18]MCK1608139.1 hypothetical protein [Bradyrhizobium sp. 163]
MPTFLFDFTDEAVPLKDGNSGGLIKADSREQQIVQGSEPANTQNDAISSRTELIDHGTRPASKP